MVVTPPAHRPAAEPAAQAAPGRLAIFAALNRRNFRYFWFAQLSAVSAQAMEFVALAWLVLELTGSPFILGLTSLAHAAPTLVFALFAGAAADRMDRRRLLWAIQGIASVVYLGVGTLVLVQAIQTWMVVMAALLIGCLRVMDQPARHGMIPHTVPRDDLPNAIAMASLAFQVPRPVAPAIAGVLIAITGIGPTYLVIAGLSLLSMTLYALLHVEAAPRSDVAQGWVGDILEGIRFVQRDQIIYGLIGMTFINSLFGMSYVVLLPVFARGVLQVGSEGYGFMQTAAGIGGLAGALAAAQLARSGQKGRQALIGAVAFGALLIGFSLSTWYLLACALLFCVGLANQLYMTTTTTVLQLSIPNALRGRVMSIWGLTFSLIPTGGAISGAVAEQLGSPFALALGGAAVIATTLAVAVSLPRIRRMD